MKKSKTGLAKIVLSTSILIIAIISVSYAWFYTSTYTSVKNINIKLVDANNLRLSEDGTSWITSITDSDGAISFNSVTGNGSKFFMMKTERRKVYDDGKGTELYGDVNVAVDELSEDECKSNLYYRKLYLISDRDVDIYLSASSYISPHDTTERINMFDYSRDYGVGAMRVAFSIKNEGDSDYTTVAVWIPNVTYQLTNDGTTKSFNENGTVEDSYIFTNSLTEGDTTEVVTNGLESGSVTIGGVNYIWGSVTEDTLLFHDDSGINEFLLTIWFENTDREADSTLSGGKLDAYIYLTSEITE